MSVGEKPNILYPRYGDPMERAEVNKPDLIKNVLLDVFMTKEIYLSQSTKK
jgi:hypothetical protein